MKKHPFLSYILLTYFITWAIALPLVFTAHNLFGLSVSYKLHYLTAYGPLISALIVVSFTKGYRGVKTLLSRALPWKVNFIWYLIALSPLLVYLLVAGFNYSNGIKTDFALLGEINFLPNLGLATLLFWILNSGLGEEVGWRGFALPHLQKRYSPIKASFVLSLFWIGWHLPFFFYLPTYINLGVSFLPFFAIGIISGTIVYTWIYNSTKGNLFLTILFHGTFNFITASKAGEGLSSAIITTFIIAGAAILLVLKPQGLKVSKTAKNNF